MFLQVLHLPQVSHERLVCPKSSLRKTSLCFSKSAPIKLVFICKSACTVFARTLRTSHHARVPSLELQHFLPAKPFTYTTKFQMVTSHCSFSSYIISALSGVVNRIVILLHGQVPSRSVLALLATSTAQAHHKCPVTWEYAGDQCT